MFREWSNWPRENRMTQKAFGVEFSHLGSNYNDSGILPCLNDVVFKVSTKGMIIRRQSCTFVESYSIDMLTLICKLVLD